KVGDQRQDDVNPGQALIVPEGPTHQIQLADDCKALEQIVLHLRIHDRWGRGFFARLDQPVVALPRPDDWHQRLKDLVAVTQPNDDVARATGEAVVRALLVDLILHGNISPNPPPDIDPRIAVALERFYDHLADPPTVGQLADGVDLGAAQFRKLFRRDVGRSPKAFMLHHRLHRAARRLRTTTDAVKRIAAETGFGTDDYFHHVFKERFGLTPTEYRRRPQQQT
ncbi:MAG: helix-turn-helix domain-containing protein, partial [Phycisphaeraceae bacterium]|nr:helix-turn-helix domain-containing protein [Phycisphaeraceae bacterium]